MFSWSPLHYPLGQPPPLPRVHCFDNTIVSSLSPYIAFTRITSECQHLLKPSSSVIASQPSPKPSNQLSLPLERVTPPNSCLPRLQIHQATSPPQPYHEVVQLAPLTTSTTPHPSTIVPSHRMPPHPCIWPHHHCVMAHFPHRAWPIASIHNASP